MENRQTENTNENLLIANIELRYRVQELRAFYDFTIELSKCENFDELIEIASKTINQTMDFTGILFFLFDEERKFLDLHPIHISPLNIPFEISVDDGAMPKILKPVLDRREFIIFNFSEFREIISEESVLEKFDCSHFSAVPLKDGSELYGLIVVGRKTEISEGEVQALQVFADQLGMALGNRKLVIEAKQRIKELSAVYELSQAINSVLELDEQLKIIVDMAADILNSERCTLMLWDEKGESLRIVAEKGWKEGVSPDEISVKLGEGIAGSVAESGEPLLIRNIEEEFGHKKMYPDQYNTKSLLTVPLKIRNKVIGVLNVNNKETNQVFTKADMRLLSTFANSAAMAIENTRLTQEKLHSSRMATIGNMANSIMHDIRNPMTVIKGYAEFIGERCPEHQKLTNIMIREVDSLVNMARDILDFSKGIKSLKLTDVVIENFVDVVIDFLKISYEKKKVRIEKDLRYQGTIRFDVGKMRRVFFNIGNNALDAMEEGGVFRIVCERQGNCVVFKLRDNGEGIPGDIKEHIFESFTSFKESGTGLGLAIAKQIVENHGGTISVESEVGKGSVFIIKFPA